MDDTNAGRYPETVEQKGMGFRLWFLIGAAAVLCVAIAVGAAVLINGNSRKQKYAAVVNTANAYYTAGDYYNAILQYEQAIAMNDKVASNYLNMSSAYMVLGDYESAQAVIERGLRSIDSAKMRERLQELEGFLAAEADTASQLSDGEIKQLSANVTMENAFFDMVAAYTYTEYYRDFGQYTSSDVSSQAVTLYYNDMNFSAVYYDLDNEKVLDDAHKMPLASVKPCYVTFDSVRRLFNSGEEQFAVSYEKLAEILGDNVELTYDEAQNRYVISANYKGCRLTVETDEHGNIVSEDAWNQLEPLSRKGLVPEEEAEGEVRGYIQDAVTGKGMTATIKVRARGSRSGQTIDEFSSERDGGYTFAGAQGTYTLEVSANGYTTEYIDAEIIRGQVKTGKSIVLSPLVGEGEVRIVLTWGSSPSDLDSHAEGRSSSGSNFHIFFQNQSVNAIGTLDVDDRNGFGPETITITDADAAFTYYVVDFTQSSAIGSSNATVKVYLPGNSQAVVYTVPAGTGNTWEVFRYEDGNITPLNTIY